MKLDIKKVLPVLLFVIVVLSGLLYVAYAPHKSYNYVGYTTHNALAYSAIELSDVQITACNAANAAQTCNTRLVELGIVEKYECCAVLGKCC